MARKALKAIRYDTMMRGTNDYIPVTFTREVFVDPETGEPLPESKYVPFNLEGRVVMMTVKEKEFDGVSPMNKLTEDEEANAGLIDRWGTQLKDEASPLSDINRSVQQDPEGPWNKDYLFRILIDCDDPSEGAKGPKDDKYPWQNNYQGMYGMDPADGKVVFRITKKMTMIAPGTYFFDIRVMEKMHKQIGMIRESRIWAPIYGTLEIQGTPTNRGTMYDWIDNSDQASDEEGEGE